ncbi:hypothetical protein [Enorma phocaeensis]|uniref:LysR family transcriptional regulator n=1 Tax=Enorma phocaeensis TaxID=1871019 RepID=A0ABT7V989_9ACTN|nr:hypothetical protein [Enorma phocaeensis]MDM8275073.1 hypothetical protein [Enorma phocaeensis]
MPAGPPDAVVFLILLKPANCVNIAQAHLVRYYGSEFRFIPLRDGLFHEYLFAAVWKKDTPIARQIRQYALGFKKVANERRALEGGGSPQ